MWKINFLQICFWSGSLPSFFFPPVPRFPLAEIALRLANSKFHQLNFDVSTGQWMYWNKTSEDVNQPSLFGFLTFSLCGSVESILNSLSLSKNSSSFWSRSLNSSSLPENQKRMEWLQWDLHLQTPLIMYIQGRGGGGTQGKLDHYTLLGNCPPTPPLSQR